MGMGENLRRRRERLGASKEKVKKQNCGSQTEEKKIENEITEQLKSLEKETPLLPLRCETLDLWTQSQHQ